MRPTVRVGVVGTGVMGERHARIFSEIAGCELVGIYDPEMTRAVAVAQRYGGSSFRLLEHLLAEVDAVSIVSPTDTHAALAHRALDLNRHILIEAPMAATMAEARLLAQRANDSGCVLLVGHVERFNPVVAALQRIIAGERVRRVTMRRIAPFSNHCLDTNGVSDLMIHDIDLVRSLFGASIVTIAARGAAVRTNQTDQAVVDMSLRNGTLISMITSRVGDSRVHQIDVVLESRWVLADLLDSSISVTSAVADASRSVTEQFTLAPAEPLRLELQHFLNCVRGVETPLVDAEAGLYAVEWVDRIDALIDHRNGALVASGQIGARR